MWFRVMSWTVAICVFEMLVYAFRAEMKCKLLYTSCLTAEQNGQHNKNM